MVLFLREVETFIEAVSPIIYSVKKLDTLDEEICLKMQPPIKVRGLQGKEQLCLGGVPEEEGRASWELAIDAITDFLSPVLSLTQCIWPPQSQLQALQL